MLHHSLGIEDVLMPEHPATWPTPLNLSLGLKELLLVEGMSLEEGDVLLQLAATLLFPLKGRVWHWDEETSRLSRPELFRLRGNIAYIPSRKVLIHRLTVLENITLAPRYHLYCTQDEAIEEHAKLIELLELEPYLSYFPPQLPDDLYFRAMWARELIKKSEIILAVPQETPIMRENYRLILAILHPYLTTRQGAVMLVGNSLEDFYPLAHRRLKLESRQLIEHHLQGPQDRHLIDFLNLL
jgi:ABC-type lipoprotein export system ATPase subunit